MQLLLGENIQTCHLLSDLHFPEEVSKDSDISLTRAPSVLLARKGCLPFTQHLHSLYFQDLCLSLALFPEFHSCLCSQVVDGSGGYMSHEMTGLKLKFTYFPCVS